MPVGSSANFNRVKADDRRDIDECQSRHPVNQLFEIPAQLNLLGAQFGELAITLLPLGIHLAVEPMQLLLQIRKKFLGSSLFGFQFDDPRFVIHVSSR